MHTIKKLKRTIVFVLKLALFASLFGIFFGIFGINNPWLFNLSRTTGVTMVTFVVLGVILGALGLYEPLVEFAGAGATVPLTGFGYLLANGVLEAETG